MKELAEAGPEEEKKEGGLQAGMQIASHPVYTVNSRSNPPPRVYNCPDYKFKCNKDGKSNFNVVASSVTECSFLIQTYIHILK